MVGSNVVIVSFSFLTASHVSVIVVRSLLFPFARKEGIQVQLVDVYLLNVFKTLEIGSGSCLGEKPADGRHFGLQML